MFTIQHAKIHFNEENTPVSDKFDDVYFSNQDGLAETHYVFLEGNQLWERWTNYQKAHFVIAETGFGTGLNFFAVTTLFREFRQKYPDSPLQQHWLNPIQGCYRFHFDETTLDLWFGDVAENLPQLGDYMNSKIDAWFLDGFAPSKNPDMWNEHLYQQMFRFTKLQGTFATFTAASAVRKGLENAGFNIKKRKGFGKKRECLSGQKTQEKPTALSTPWFHSQSANLNKQDIAIIGGGIASLCTAISLVKRGAKITIYCEDELTALNASGNKQGAFYPQLSDDNERNIRFYIHAFAYGHQFLQWAIQQQIEFEHEFCGVALCAYNEKAESKLNKIAELNLPSDLYQSLNQTKLSEKVGLPLPFGGGFIPQGAWLAPRQLVQHAFAFLEKQGVQIKTSQKVTALSQTEQGWQINTAENETFFHEVVVLANGHKLTEFEQTRKLPLYPVRGQVSQIPTSANLLKLKTVLCYDGYLTPVDQAKASHCIGASHVRDNATREFSLTEQQENQQKIQQNIPEDWTKEVNTSGNLARIGVRCSVRALTPMMGAVPHFSAQQTQYQNLFNLRRRKQPIEQAVNYPNLYLIGALGSRGLTSAPFLGETLASLIYDEPLPMSEDLIHNLMPNRSWVRRWLKGAEVK